MAIYPTFPGGKRKAFTVSYDDGWPQDRRLIGLMNKYGIKGTFNLNSGEKLFTNIDNPKELYKGHEVAVHTLSHAYLNRVAPQTATYEVIKDRENLEKVFGGTVRGLAYPHSAFDEETIQILKNCGIKYARTVQCNPNFGLPTDWYRWNPSCTDLDPKLLDICDKFLDLEILFNQSYVFSVYGHAHFLDDEEGRWERVEAMYQKISESDDIWCATNIEICDYLSAFKQLVMSVDCKYIYNPTTTTLSLIYNKDGDFINSSEIFEIKPGEEIILP